MRSRRSTFKRRSKGYKQVKPYSLIDGKSKHALKCALYMSKRLCPSSLNSTTWSRSKGPIQIMKRSLNATTWSRSKDGEWSAKAINRGANQEKTQHKDNTTKHILLELKLPFSSILLWGSKCVQRCFKKVQAHSSLQVIKLATRLFSYSFILSFERREF